MSLPLDTPPVDTPSLNTLPFADALARAAPAHPCLRPIEARVRAPLRVAVLGRRGVGRAAVGRALAMSGLRIVAADARPDVCVVVIAEALKPEDHPMLRSGCPTVVVLNKADLAGTDPGGPLAAARRDAARIASAVGLVVVPMIALLAAVELDDEEAAGLRELAGTAVDMTSTDAFVDTDHAVPAPLRRRLLAKLDRFGLAHAVLALADGADAASVGRTLHALSQADRVTERITSCAAEVTYRRVCAALDELHRTAAQTGDDALAAFLSADEVVLAVMAAAVDAMEAAGLRVDPGDDGEAHLRRARHWRRYADGPLDAVHRRCAADITRGSMRLLGRSR